VGGNLLRNWKTLKSLKDFAFPTVEKRMREREREKKKNREGEGERSGR
jgi:hypothetical protein